MDDRTICTAVYLMIESIGALSHTGILYCILILIYEYIRSCDTVHDCRWYDMSSTILLIRSRNRSRTFNLVH